MRIPGHESAHLTYCLNIHPGETWDEQFAAIRTHATAVRDRVGRGRPFGLGLRMGCRSVGALADPAQRDAFRRYLADQGLYAFTINGFPYGTFHGTAVKTDVYRPDWRDPDRLAYTQTLGTILADLLPEGQDGSISTVPGSYGAWIRSSADRQLMAEQLAACARHFHALRLKTGHEIHLGLEPEPDCFLERTDAVIDFFEQNVLPVGSGWLVREAGLSRPDAEAVLRRHIGVCFDTCHLAVQFEDLVDSVRRMHTRGVRISKVQLSAALKLRADRESLDQLRPFVDAVYLHQVKIRRESGARESLPDLQPDCLGLPDPSAEWRVHFHVPLYVGDYGRLRSTGDDVTPGLLGEMENAGVRHFEIETYTFGVLPESLRARPVADSIAAEYQWVLQRFAGAAPGKASS